MKKWYYLKNKYLGTQTPEQTEKIMKSFTRQAVKNMISKLDPKLVKSFSSK